MAEILGAQNVSLLPMTVTGSTSTSITVTGSVNNLSVYQGAGLISFALYSSASGGSVTASLQTSPSGATAPWTTVASVSFNTSSFGAVTSSGVLGYSSFTSAGPYFVNQSDVNVRVVLQSSATLGGGQVDFFGVSKYEGFGNN